MHLSGLLCTWKTLQLHLTLLTTILLAMHKKKPKNEEEEETLLISCHMFL